MRVLPYYIVHTVINSIKKLFKTWVAIFIAICLGLGLVGGIIGVVVGTVVEDSSIDSSAEEIIEEEDEIPEMTPEETAEMQSFITGGIALLTFIVILFSIYGGDKSGAKIFTMPDVNFLFASPMKPQSILMFRMILQMGVAIASSIYLLFQLPNLTMNVGLSIKTCLTVFLGYGILLYLSRLASVFTYTVTATHETLRKFIRPFVIGILMLLSVGYLAVVHLGKMDYFEAVLYICSFRYMKYIPVFGWLSGLIMSTVNGTLAEFFIFLVLIVAAIIGLTALIWQIKADFYEDAFSGASEMQETLEAAQKGETKKRKKDRSEKLMRNGEFKGQGAYMFLSKTVYNRRRFSKLGIFSGTALTYSLITLAFCSSLAFLVDFKSILPIGFIMLVCIFFRNLGNPLADEMNRSYIFTVPESPFRKLFYSIAGGLYETVCDLVPVFLIAAVSVPEETANLVLWFILWVSLDAFCSSVGLFTELAIPSAVVPSIKAMFGVFIRMFAIVPGLIMVIISAAANMPLFIILTILLNLAVATVLISISQFFLHAGKK